MRLIHKSEITELLKDMCNSGMLITEGYGRGTKYKLPSSSVNMATSTANMATSTANMATSTANMATSTVYMVTSTANMASSDAYNQTTIKKRMKPEELEVLIKKKCEDWISLEELSTEIDRSPKYLRSVVIPRLIDNDTLEMMFPTIPNHPKQKYKLK